MMSFTKTENKHGPVYYDINSDSRNRKSFPNPCDFVIPISQSTSSLNGISSQSPVSLAVPYETGTTVAVSQTAVTLAATASSINNFYTGSVLELPNDATVGAIPRQFALITAYNGSTKVATLQFASAPTSGNTQYYDIRKAAPVLQGVVGASTTSTIVLPVTANTTTDYYKGSFIGFSNDPTLTPTAAIRGLTRIILAYDGTTRTLTIDPLPVAPAVGSDNFDIDMFTEDSYNPLKYTGTGVFSQDVCYEMKLESLTMPNQELSNSSSNSPQNIGGRLNYYPFVYVNFYSETNIASYQTIYSNNKNVSKATFKVPITYNIDPSTDNMPYFTLSDITPKIIKFKPNDTLRFTITLPNGQVVKYATADNVSPLFPNPLLQTSAFISAIRKD